MVESRGTVIEQALELINELDPIFNGFRFNQLDAQGIVTQVQEGIIRVNCFDCGDISDVYSTFHFHRVLKMVFFSESTTFEAFARGFIGASTINVMAVRGMLVNLFKRTNELLNCKESVVAQSLSTEMPLEFLVLKEKANKIVSRY